MSEEEYYYDDLSGPPPDYGDSGGIAEVDDTADEDESGPRFAWKITSIIIVVLTLLLNLILVGVILVKRTSSNDLINKALLCVGLVDLLYGVFASPFFIENYIDIHWNQSLGYCRFYEYIFSFHDLFLPLVLTALSAYVALKYSGANQTMKFRRQIYIGTFLVIIIFSVLLAIPSAIQSNFVMDDTGTEFRIECRTKETYSMVLAYFFGSALLFCFAMSFLFSLCVVGSPLLRDVYDDPTAYSQRWRLLLTLSLINGLYIVSGFLLNFKEVSRYIFDCCEIEEPFLGTDTLTYDIWSFTMLLSEPMLRPLVTLGFYYKYVSRIPKLDKYGRRTYRA